MVDFSNCWICLPFFWVLGNPWRWDAVGRFWLQSFLFMASFFFNRARIEKKGPYFQITNVMIVFDLFKLRCVTTCNTIHFSWYSFSSDYLTRHQGLMKQKRQKHRSPWLVKRSHRATHGLSFSGEVISAYLRLL